MSNLSNQPPKYAKHKATGRAVIRLKTRDRCLGPYGLTESHRKYQQFVIEWMIEVKGTGAADGTVILTPNEHRVAQDRRDCYRLYVVTHCDTEPKLTAVKDPAGQPWQPVQNVQQYTLPTREIAD